MALEHGGSAGHDTPAVPLADAGTEGRVGPVLDPGGCVLHLRL